MTKVKKVTGVAVLFALMLLAVPLTSMADTTVADDVRTLKGAIASGDDVLIDRDFVITETITIPADYKGSIKARVNNTLTLAPGVENMFDIKSGAEVSFVELTLDGKNNGRLMNIGKAAVTIKSGTLKNGSTESLGAVEVNGVDTQRYDGGAIYAEHATLVLQDTTFAENSTKAVVPVPGTPHGGAIYSASANITVSGGKFLNNHTGKVNVKNGSHGEGGAIKLASGSTLTINEETTAEKDKTLFEGNHLDSWADEGGRQGGAIEATESKVYVYGTTFKIPGPFNTGGAIKFEGSPEAKIKNSAFVLEAGKGDNFGIAGGAITSENSHLSIDRSSFKTGDNTRVKEAGGLIQVVGGGTFHLTRSTLTGSGASFNGNKYTAKYGGAISFYGNEASQTSVKAVIEDTTIENFMADGSGAGISVANGHGQKAAADLTLKNTKLTNNAAYTWDDRGHGGGMFVGAGNTVLMEGGSIGGPTASNNAGGIYNEGRVTVTGGAVISGNKGYQMVGGIYNNGYLKVDDATVSNNTRGDWSIGDGHSLDGTEMSGQNIYADKDVIITPNAKFDDLDVRVIHGQSAIVLTGALPNRINVSISEKAKTGGSELQAEYTESQIRHLGYVVAKGDGTYAPTAEDAKKLHYVTKDKTQPAADYADHTSIGKWDYVLNPETKQVVLGQRAKLVYHANTGKFAGSNNELTKEQPITVYKAGQTGFDKDTTLDPQKDAYRFVDWYKESAKTSVQDMASESANAGDKFNFAEAVVAGNGPITTILDPNVFNVYAGYLRNAPVTKYKATHEFKAATGVSVTLPKAITDRTPKPQLDLLDGATVSPTNTFDKSDYADATNDGVWSFEKWDKTEATIQGKDVNFVGTWTFKKNTAQEPPNPPGPDAPKFLVTHEFKAAAGVSVKLPKAIKDRTPADQTDKENGTKVTPTDTFDKTPYRDAANNGVWTFEKWDKTEATIDNANRHFVGTWLFKKNEAPVNPVDPPNPNEPATPDNPPTPEKPAPAVSKPKATDKTPKTGDAGTAGYLLLLGLSTAAVFVTGRIYRKNKED